MRYTFLKRADFWFIIICSVLCGLISYFTPYNHDDLNYRMPYRIIEDGVVTDSVRGMGIISFVKYSIGHYIEVNARLGDKLLLIALLLPKWVSALFTTISVAGVLSALKFIAKSVRSVYLVLLCAVVLVFSLPWYQLMFTTAFSVNYIWGGTLSLLCFAFMTENICVRSVWADVAVSVICGVAGAWHEGFAMCLCAGILVYFIVLRFKVQRKQIVFWVFWSLGTIFTLCSPASWQRLDDSGGGFTFVRLMSPELLAYFNVALLYLPLFIVSMCFSRFRKTVLTCEKAVLCAIIGIVIVNLYILGRTYPEARITMFSSLYAIPGIFLIISIWRRTCKAHRRLLLMNIVTVLCVVVTIAHLGYSLYWQLQLDKEYKEVKAFYISASDDSPLYYDILTDKSGLTLGKASFYQFHNAWGLETFSKYYDGSDVKQLRILPTKFKELNPSSQGSHMGGKFDVYIVDGCLFAKLLGNNRHYSLQYTFSDGRSVNINTIATTFYAPDGWRYAYLEPVVKPFTDYSTPVKLE